MVEIIKGIKRLRKRRKKDYKSPVVLWGSIWRKKNDQNKDNKSNSTNPMDKKTTNNSQ
jgi:hypothetical protein